MFSPNWLIQWSEGGGVTVTSRCFTLWNAVLSPETHLNGNSMRRMLYKNLCHILHSIRWQHELYIYANIYDIEQFPPMTYHLIKKICVICFYDHNYVQLLWKYFRVWILISQQAGIPLILLSPSLSHLVNTHNTCFHASWRWEFYEFHVTASPFGNDFQIFLFIYCMHAELNEFCHACQNVKHFK